MKAYFNTTRTKPKRIGLSLKLVVLGNPGRIQLSLSQAKADPTIAWARWALGRSTLLKPVVPAIREIWTSRKKRKDSS